MLRRTAPFLALALLAILLAAARSPIPLEHTLASFFATMARDLWAPLLWMLSAWGLGLALLGATRTPHSSASRGEPTRSPHAPASLTAATGIAFLLLIDQIAGSLGALAFPMVAWLLLLPGLSMVFARTFARLRGSERSTEDRLECSWARAAPLWLLAPAVGTLLFAAASSPGHLWSTEFRGYDALTYHLALPRTWLEGGRLEPLAWNAYSYLPSWIEGATLHLFALHGDPTLQGIRAQLLHALLAIVAMAVTADAARAMIGRGVLGSVATSAPASGAAPIASIAALLGAACFIGTPWIIVTGSMAYNEMGAALGTAGMLLVWWSDRSLRCRAVLIGLLAAMTIGSKLSAGVMALPAAVIVIGLADARTMRTLGAARLGGAVALAAVIAAVALAPWLLRNALATGNPLFPFAATLLGDGGWTQEQIDAWRHAHGAAGGLPARLTQLWQQLFIFGFGASPSPGEPWRPFWAALPWLAIAALALLASARETRRCACAFGAALAAALVAWLLFTHMKSRFLVPTSPVAAITVALAAAACLQRWHAPAWRSGVLAVAAALSLQPVAAFWSEGPQAALMIGAERTMTGDELAEAIAAAPSSEMARSAPRSRAFVLNADIAGTARRDGQRVLLIGDAAVFRYRAPVQSSTVWTRDPLVRQLLAAPDSDAVLAALHAARIAWVLIDDEMLSVWARSGWLDSDLTAESLSRMTAPLRPHMRFPNGSRLYEVPGARPSSSGVLR